MEDIHIKQRDRSQISEYYKWNLTDIYPDDASWREAKKGLLAAFADIAVYRGGLAQSPRRLLDCLELVSRLRKELTRLACYASMHSDLDTRDATRMAMDQEMGQVGSDFSALTSFFEPEILRMNRDLIDRFVEQEPGLVTYRHILDDILRKKEHTGSEPEEKLIADAGLMADSPGSIFNIFSNADLPFPDVTLEDGTPVRLDPVAFSLLRQSRVRADRKKVFTAYLGKIYEFRRTFGAQLYAELRKDMFFARARHYGSCLECALDPHNIPITVYRNLVDGVHAHFDTFHRYLNLRKKLLRLDALHYYDLYAPIVSEVDHSYTFEEASEHVLASLAPLGEEYRNVARRAFKSRWFDVYHNDGKRSGAYSNGAVYDVHPYVLLNYNGRYDDVSTLAHELGHTMHSHLSNLNQPYALSHYSIFVAEVASTFNEALLLDYMLRTLDRDDVRLSLLGHYLDGVRATVFRQVQFAEFELRIHETAEKGEALTGDLLSSIYEEIVREYYGHERGICVVDDQIKAEWAYIPHFYYNFYVYQYATSFTASAAIVEQVLAGDAAAARRYLSLLSAGGSGYPIDLLKKAGIDMTTTGPLEATMQHMNRVMDEAEIVARRLDLL
jgi:oligoendopeptidase F